VRVISPLRSRHGTHQLTVELHPHDLGVVAATVEVSGRSVRLSFVAEQSATTDILRRAAHEIRSSLAEAGITVAQLEVGGETVRPAVPANGLHREQTSGNSFGQPTGDPGRRQGDGGRERENSPGTALSPTPSAGALRRAGVPRTPLQFGGPFHGESNRDRLDLIV
jgi:hypothetical protein